MARLPQTDAAAAEPVAMALSRDLHGDVDGDLTDRRRFSPCGGRDGGRDGRLPHPLRAPCPAAPESGQHLPALRPPRRRRIASRKPPLRRPPHPDTPHETIPLRMAAAHPELRSWTGASPSSWPWPCKQGGSQPASTCWLAVQKRSSRSRMMGSGPEAGAHAKLLPGQNVAGGRSAVQRHWAARLRVRALAAATDYQYGIHRSNPK